MKYVIKPRLAKVKFKVEVFMQNHTNDLDFNDVASKKKQESKSVGLSQRKCQGHLRVNDRVKYTFQTIFAYLKFFQY